MIRFVYLTTVAAALLTAGPAAASPFGQSVSGCAHASLPPSPPQVTCTHDGQAHTFANFGKMVAHMREHGA